MFTMMMMMLVAGGGRYIRRTLRIKIAPA